MKRMVGGMVGGFLATALVAVLCVWAVTWHSETVQWIFENGLVIKNGSETVGLTVTTSDTGNGMVVLPANSVGLGSEVSGFAEPVTFCGQLVDGSSSPATVYLGPGLLGLNGTPTDYIMGGTACDALESGTEATADAPISTLAVKVVGMRCKQSAASGSSKTTTYTLRTAAADAVTTDGSATVLTCDIAGATATECRTVAGTTTDIAAGATMAVKALTDANLSAQDARCQVMVAWP